MGGHHAMKEVKFKVPTRTHCFGITPPTDIGPTLDHMAQKLSEEATKDTTVRPLVFALFRAQLSVMFHPEKKEETIETMPVDIPDNEPEYDMDWLNGGMTPVGPVDKETFEKALKLLSRI